MKPVLTGRGSERKSHVNRLAFALMAAMMIMAGCAPRRVPATTPASPTNTPPAAASVATPAQTVQVTRDIEYTRPVEPTVSAQKLDVYGPDQSGPRWCFCFYGMFTGQALG